MKVTVDVDCTPEEARRFMGLPDMTGDPRVQRRRAELVADARILLDAIAQLSPAGCDPMVAATIR